LALPEVDVGAGDGADAGAGWAIAGMPFMRNSTATSGFPCAALRQARASASGKPILVRLESTSAGNESDATGAAGVGAGGAGAGVGAAGVAVDATGAGVDGAAALDEVEGAT